jgi:DNA repair protein RecN (Recombination protein N)
MLKQLSIKNYALIEESTIYFPYGYIVITGETGAGKSILLGALGLVLGNRADSDALFDKSKKCVVEAVFDITNLQLEHLFETHDIDFEKETCIRREINADGKSRAFVNDTPVTLAVLKELSERLIDVHSQHQTLLLNQHSFQFKLIDSFAQLKQQLQNYSGDFTNYQLVKKQLFELKAKEAQLKKEQDFLQFQLNELDQFSPKEEELELLEKESEVLENAESIKHQLTTISEIINGDHENVITQLNTLKPIVSQLSRFGENYNELNKRFSEVYIELKDIAAESASLCDDISADPERLQIVNERLDTYNRLLKKHNAANETALITIWKEMEEKLSVIQSFDEDVARLEKEMNTSHKKLLSQAKLLSDQRKKIIPEIENSVSQMLEQLSMPNAKFKIELKEKAELGILGKDEINFLFSANKGSEFKDIEKVASGGELSRLMLCIKSLAAQKTALPVIIFDEIDTGVSGDVADKIGLILQAMGKNRQVISITHLPQIASKGSSHLFVYKEDHPTKTISKIKLLQNEERILEIAKMLSSGKPGEAAINNAKELLQLNLCK